MMMDPTVNVFSDEGSFYLPAWTNKRRRSEEIRVDTVRYILCTCMLRRERYILDGYSFRWEEYNVRRC